MESSRGFELDRLLRFVHHLSNNLTTCWNVVDVENQIPTTPGQRVRAVTQSVTPGFFRLMRIRFALAARWKRLTIPRTHASRSSAA
jgi:hypothetical protein